MRRQVRPAHPHLRQAPHRRGEADGRVDRRRLSPQQPPAVTKSWRLVRSQCPEPGRRAKDRPRPSGQRPRSRGRPLLRRQNRSPTMKLDKGNFGEVGVEFGIFSNGERNNQVAADSYDEDLFEVRLADRLGMREAWISEHLRGTHGGRPDALSAADLFICKAAAYTKQIRLGPGVRPLPLYQPIQVALEAAVCDHLTRGRYLFGFGVGVPLDNGMVQRGIAEESSAVRRARMHESIDLILRCWTAREPFDYEGEFFHGREIRVVPKPYQQPHMPIGVA